MANAWGVGHDAVKSSKEIVGGVGLTSSDDATYDIMRGPRTLSRGARVAAGKLSGWTAPKDVILKLAGILTVRTLPPDLPRLIDRHSV
jgi:hypothetical protein